jgi:hypothetical protein
VVRFGGELERYAWFEGKEHEISFVTTSGPMSSQGGGLLLVFYRFDESEKAVVYGQKIVLDEKDVRDGVPDSTDSGDRKALLDKGWDINVVGGISDLRFTYAARRDDLQQEAGSWPGSWNRRKRVPLAVSLAIGFVDNGRRDEREEAEEGSGVRVFYPGYFGDVREGGR